MDRKVIGEKLRTLRGPRTMAEISDATGIGHSALNMYELGERIPRDDVKLKLAKFYGVNVEWLFFEDDFTKREVPAVQ